MAAPRDSRAAGDSAPDTTAEILDADVAAGEVAPVGGDAEVSAPSAPAVGDWLRVELMGGEEVAGELVAIYDHRLFWQAPSQRETWALFDPRRLASSPYQDKSFRFVDSTLITRREVRAWPAGVATYQQTLRELGVVFERVPLAGPTWVLNGWERWHLAEDGYGQFAWDLTYAEGGGQTWRDFGNDNQDFYVWEAPVRSPVGGVLTELRDDVADHAPTADDPPLGSPTNRVGVQVYGAFYAYLLHLRQGSAPDGLVTGERLEAGALVGAVGNNGVSQAPHLHITLLWWDAEAGRSWSVPVEFHQIYLGVTPDVGAQETWAQPSTGEWIGDAPFAAP